VFAVAKIFAVRFSTCARQRNLCRAKTRGKDAMHGKESFSRIHATSEDMPHTQIFVAYDFQNISILFVWL
jgi:hypothetical protein